MKQIIVAVLTFGLVACGGPDDTPKTTAELADPGLNTTELSGEIIGAGTLEGRSDHITTGGVSIRKEADGYYVVLEQDFSLDGAPDPKLGFGNPDFVSETLFAELRALTGEQVYKLPDGFDPTQYSTFYVWCERFSVPLGEATLADAS